MRNSKPAGQNLCLQSCNVGLIHQLVGNSRNRILPDQFLCRNFWAKIAGTRAHVTVGQLEPSSCKGILEFFRIVQKVPSDGLVDGIKTQSQVGCGHDGGMGLAGIVGIYNSFCSFRICGNPLVCSCRTLYQIPVILEQRLQIAHIPFGGIWFPSSFNTAGDGVTTFTSTEFIVPAQAHFFNGGSFWLWSHISGISCSVGFTKGMTTSNEGNGFLIIHAHSSKGGADVTARSHCIRHTVGAFGIYVNQSHLYSCQGIVQLAVASVAIVIKPLLF